MRETKAFYTPLVIVSGIALVLVLTIVVRSILEI